VELFFDPELMFRLRERVVPELRTWPWPMVWVAGCGTGELAYALAIVLREEGVFARTTVYATDADAGKLAIAERGVWDVVDRPRAEAAYRLAGGRASLSEYLRGDGGRVEVKPSLRERMAFFQHDPLVDGSPNEFQLIVAGDALATALPEDAARMFSLYHASLCRFGTFALIRGVSLAAHPRRSSYASIAEGASIYRRMR
jgi:chemotaxis protein methyltransferase CheR